MSPHARTSLVLACSLLAAAAATAVVYRAVSAQPTRGSAALTRAVVVAARPLPLGSRLTAADVRVVRWPADSPLEGSVSQVGDALGRGLLTGLLANEPITTARLAPTEAGAGLPPSIPDGWRAMSVKVNEVIGVAGFVAPGTRVDVVVSLRGSGPQGAPISRVVVSSVQVLAAGTRYDQDDAHEGAPTPASVVTLLVTPADSERIALAAAEGQLTLTLRNPLDTEPTRTRGARLATLLAGTDVPPPDPPSDLSPPALPRPAARPVLQASAGTAETLPSIYTVETIRAARRSAEVVR